MSRETQNSRLCRGCCNKTDDDGSDEMVNFLIFGTTGLIGKAVATAAAGSPWFRVYGFSRKPMTDEMKESFSGVEFFIGDMLDYDTVRRATKDMDVVFLSTFFWETMNPKIEYAQGCNVVNASLQNGVKQLIYNGTDYIDIVPENQRCLFLEAKAQITSYIVYSGIPYTIIRMAWCYENFFSVFRPHPVTKTRFAIALPMMHAALNMGSLKDLSTCILTIAVRHGGHVYRTLQLSSTYLTVKEMADTFNTYFPEYEFFDPEITVDDYKALNFKGSKELASMFKHYITQRQWNTTVMYNRCISPLTFSDWVMGNKKELQFALDEQVAAVDHLNELKKWHQERMEKIRRTRQKETSAWKIFDKLEPVLGLIKESSV